MYISNGLFSKNLVCVWGTGKQTKKKVGKKADHCVQVLELERITDSMEGCGGMGFFSIVDKGITGFNGWKLLNKFNLKIKCNFLAPRFNYLFCSLSWKVGAHFH